MRKNLDISEEAEIALTIEVIKQILKRQYVSKAFHITREKGW